MHAPGRHHRHPLHDNLAPGDLGAVDGHNRHHHHHHHAGVGQDLGGLVGLEAHRSQDGSERIAAMPQPPRRVELQPTPILLGVDHEHPPGPMARWSRLARLPGTARSWRSTHPYRSSGPSSRAVRRSPAAPRRPAIASGLTQNRSPQPATTAASAVTTNPSRGANRLPRTPPPTPTPSVTATRQGRVRVQAAHSAARSRRHCAWVEPPGRPMLARTRTVTTGRSAWVPGSSSSGSSPRWARMACSSAGLSGRTDPLGRSSSSMGHDRELAIGSSFLLVLAGPLRAWPATLLARLR
jgi:hypothetical protein